MTIWVTKWALARGAIVRYDDAEPIVVQGRKGNRNCVRVRVRSLNGGRMLKFWPGEWHLTEAAAITRAEDLRRTMLEGLARHADFVASLQFRVSTCR